MRRWIPSPTALNSSMAPTVHLNERRSVLPCWQHLEWRVISMNFVAMQREGRVH
jgi:hypothetical protein